MRRRANLKASSRFPHKIHFRPKFTLVFFIFFFGSCCACLSDSHAATASVASVPSVASVGGRRVKILAEVDSLTSLSQASTQGLPNLTHRSVAWHHIRSVRFGSASDAQIIRNMVVISMRHKQCLAGPLNCAESDAAAAAAAAATSKMATTNMLTMIMMMMMIIHTTMIMLSWLASSTNLMGTDSCLSPFALPTRVCSLPQSRS